MIQTCTMRWNLTLYKKGMYIYLVYIKKGHAMAQLILGWGYYFLLGRTFYWLIVLILILILTIFTYKSYQNNIQTIRLGSILVVCTDNAKKRYEFCNTTLRKLCNVEMWGTVLAKNQHTCTSGDYSTRNGEFPTSKRHEYKSRIQIVRIDSSL